MTFKEVNFTLKLLFISSKQKKVFQRYPIIVDTDVISPFMEMWVGRKFGNSILFYRSYTIICCQIFSVIIQAVLST